MFVRETVVKKGGKSYRYVRLVRSFRRPKDGVPTHRVIANLGGLPEEEVAVLKKALAAMREGKELVVVDHAAGAGLGWEVALSLSYLPVAVFRELWREWGLGECLNRAVKSEADVPLSEVVAVLVTQRCVCPASKLKATRWYPTTALPELTGLAQGPFNNSRVHRCLAQLEEVTSVLQSEVASRVASARKGPCVAMFLDLTDTWFVGEGPSLARMGRTKEGLLRMKVQIALLCDEVGYPLRWKVVEGSKDEAKSMFEIVADVKDEPWLGEAPLVMDRAMGRGARIRSLLDQGVRFVTAVPENEFESYDRRPPFEPFSELMAEAFPPDGALPLKQAIEAARSAGMSQKTETEFFLDVPLLSPRKADSGSSSMSSIDCGGLYELGGMADAMELAREMKRALDDGQVRTYAEAGAPYELGEQQVFRRMEMLRLAPDIQQSILRGEAEVLSVKTLRAVGKLPGWDEQRAEYDRLLATPEEHWPRTKPRPCILAERPSPYQFKAVVHFNCERFVDQRRRALAKAAKLHDFVRCLNADLAASATRKKKANLVYDVTRKLEKLGLTSCFDFQVIKTTIGGKSIHQVKVVRNDHKWRRRIRYHGFSLIVAHPQVAQSGADLIDLYHSKDKVEKDFQTIKSQIDLRPVRHYTDAKVSAHVTLCILALLLQRSLEQRLANHGIPMTAAAAVELLDTCKLNRLETTAGLSAYSTTRATEEQGRILQALGLDRLLDGEYLAEALEPR